MKNHWRMNHFHWVNPTDIEPAVFDAVFYAALDDEDEEMLLLSDTRLSDGDRQAILDMNKDDE